VNQTRSRHPWQLNEGGIGKKADARMRVCVAQEEDGKAEEKAVAFRKRPSAQNAYSWFHQSAKSGGTFILLTSVDIKTTRTTTPHRRAVGPQAKI
jgi:hypothetical protein